MIIGSYTAPAHTAFLEQGLRHMCGQDLQNEKKKIQKQINKCDERKNQMGQDKQK